MWGCDASMRKYKLIWHKFMLKYNIISYNDCLDGKLKKKLLNKIEYHETEIHRIVQSEHTAVKNNYKY